MIFKKLHPERIATHSYYMRFLKQRAHLDKKKAFY